MTLTPHDISNVRRALALIKIVISETAAELQFRERSISHAYIKAIQVNFNTY